MTKLRERQSLLSAGFNGTVQNAHWTVQQLDSRWMTDLFSSMSWLAESHVCDESGENISCLIDSLFHDNLIHTCTSCAFSSEIDQLGQQLVTRSQQKNRNFRIGNGLFAVSQTKLTRILIFPEKKHIGWRKQRDVRRVGGPPVPIRGGPLLRSAGRPRADFSCNLRARSKSTKLRDRGSPVAPHHRTMHVFTWNNCWWLNEEVHFNEVSLKLQSSSWVPTNIQVSGFVAISIIERYQFEA